MAKSARPGKVRYAVVGVGWISQQAFLPAVAHTGNSELAALVTGDREKAQVLGAKYGARHTCGYDGYDALLRSGEIDAVYIATPNTMHRDYAVRALDAGIHVLCEKPMAPSEEDCQAMIDASVNSGAKLMIAYRLHFEPATLKALEIVRAGRLGEVRAFSSVFAQQVAPANHRAHSEYWAGPLADMGPYPINMARQVFQAEPVEAMAFACSPGEPLHGVPKTVASILRFPGDRLAQFTISYCAEPIDQYRIIGSKGHLEADPAYDFYSGLHLRLAAGEDGADMPFAHTDQFGGELMYFSDCILGDRAVEPDGEEGLADVRVIRALQESLKAGRPQRIAPLHRRRWPDPAQCTDLPPVLEDKLINAAPPGGS